MFLLLLFCYEDKIGQVDDPSDDGAAGSKVERCFTGSLEVSLA